VADELEVPLAGGRATPGVVRVGERVRRPLKPDSERVHALLALLERHGFDGAPRFLGVDPKGREILTFIEGFAPPHNGFRLAEEGVRAGARLVRRVHDLTEGTTFAQDGEVACHPNLSQPNFVFRDLVPVAIIDWDGTQPGTKLANFADFLWAFVHPACTRRMKQPCACWPWRPMSTGGPAVASSTPCLRASAGSTPSSRAMRKPPIGQTASSPTWNATKSYSAPSSVSLRQEMPKAG
jgi:hypothetical protein